MKSFPNFPHIRALFIQVQFLLGLIQSQRSYLHNFTNWEGANFLFYFQLLRRREFKKFSGKEFFYFAEVAVVTSRGQIVL